MKRFPGRAWPVYMALGIGWTVVGGIWLARGGPGTGLVFIGLACFGIGASGLWSHRRVG